MAKSKTMVRIPLFFLPPVLDRIRRLAARYGVTVSEVVRRAVAKGLPEVPAELRRPRAARLRAPREGRPGARGGGASAPADSMVAELVRSAQSICTLDVDLGPDALRRALARQAELLQVSPDELDDVVEEALNRATPEPPPGFGIVPALDPTRPPD